MPALPAQVAVLQLFLGDQRAFLEFVPAFLEIVLQLFRTSSAIEVHPQFQQDLIEGMVLLLHLLMVAPALFRLSGGDEASHVLEDLVRSSKILEDEVFAVDLQEPMVFLVFFVGPMPLLDVLFLLLSRLQLHMTAPFLGFLLVLLPCKADVALLSKERLEVVTRYHLFLLRIMRTWHDGHVRSFFPLNKINSSRQCSWCCMWAEILMLRRCFLGSLVSMSLALHFSIMFSNVMYRIKKQQINKICSLIQKSVITPTQEFGIFFR